MSVGDLNLGPHASRASALTHKAMSLAQDRHIFTFSNITYHVEGLDRMMNLMEVLRTSAISQMY